MEDITRKKIEQFRKDNLDLELFVLREKLGMTVSEMWWYEIKYEHFKKVECPEMMMYAGGKVKELNGQVSAILRRIQNLEGKPEKCDRPNITDDMIQNARNHPFENLHPFKRNMASCPFHADKMPSMSLKNNRVMCWAGCTDKPIDTIEFLMRKDGLSFWEAVRRLS